MNIMSIEASIESGVNTDGSIKSNVGVNAGIGRIVEINGTTNYEKLSNKPRIEGIELVGNLCFPQLNLSRITETELEDMLKL